MIGTTISRFKILEKLGEGGMGVVYKAQDLNLKRFVALKFLPPESHISSDDIFRFRQEANVIASLNHPNIATIHDLDEDKGMKFLVLEYMAGGTLREKIRDTHASGVELPVSQILEFGIQIAEGLADAHKHGIIHRDVKSENIMLTVEGRIRIADFGLAILHGTAHGTEAESIVGTTAYMSPEQIRGEEVDHRTDLFSYGIVLYELTTGHLPFPGEHQAALSYSILNEEPVSIESFRSNVPPGLQSIIGRCLEKDRKNRYQNAAEIVEALREIQLDSDPNRRRIDRRSVLHWMIPAALLIVIGLAAYLYFFPKTHADLKKSVAVVPFQSFSENMEDQYFSDGITEDVITDLANVADIKVISRTSMMRYKNTDKSIREIGSELNVGAVLEGSVRRSGNQVRIVAQLIDASTDEHMWAESYDEALTNILIIQSRVAQKIVHSLEARLSPQETKQIESRTTVDVDAYDAYLRGRFHLSKRTPDDLMKAVDYFQKSMDKDPAYVPAYAGMSDAYTLIGNFNVRPPQEVYPKAKGVAQKALQIDERQGEAHVSLALAHMHYDWDWRAADQEFRRGIELSPGYAVAHSWYSLYLTLMGRKDEAIKYRRRAKELDPLSPVIATDGALELYFDRKYDEVIQQCRSVLQNDPLFVAAYIPLGGAYLRKSIYQEAIESFGKASMFSKGHPITVAAVGYAFALSSRREDAIQMVDLLKERAQEEYVSPYWIAVVYAGVGMNDQVLYWLEKAYSDRDGSMVFLKMDPVWDQLRQDERFISLLRKLKLDDR